MADETTANPPVVTELIPSVEGKVSGVASGLRALKEAIEKIELLAQPTASGEKN